MKITFLKEKFLNHCRGRGSISMDKRGTFVYDQNQTILCRKVLKICSPITAEMAFSYRVVLLQKGHFLSSKRGRSFKKYFFRF